MYMDKIKVKKVTFLGNRRIDVVLETSIKDFFVGNILKCTIHDEDSLVGDKISFFRIIEISNTSKKIHDFNTILEVKASWYGRYNELSQNYKTMEQLLDHDNWKVADIEEARKIEKEAGFF